jgi:hypothetical protein
MTLKTDLGLFGGVGRRLYPRNVVLGRLDVRLLTCPMPAIARDISLDGFSLETPEAIEVGSPHLVGFSFLDLLVETNAACVHCEQVAPSGWPIYLAGFVFDPLDPQARSFVHALMRLVK